MMVLGMSINDQANYSTQTHVKKFEFWLIQLVFVSVYDLNFRDKLSKNLIEKLQFRILKFENCNGSNEIWVVKFIGES